MAKLTTRAAALALTLGLAAAAPAAAQVGPEARPYILGRPGPDRDAYGPPPPGRRPPPPPDDADGWHRPPPPPPVDDAYDRPPPRRRYRAEPRRWDDSVCVTARGTCLTRAAPPDAPCGCAIPGFGYARGQIED